MIQIMVFVQDRKVLQKSSPGISWQFSISQWAVQDHPGLFCGIQYCDIKLEQIIKSYQKGQETTLQLERHKKRSVTQFQLLFHEIIEIINQFWSMTSEKSKNRADYNLINYFAPPQNTLFNKNVVKLTEFSKREQTHTTSFSLSFTQHSNPTVFSSRYLTKCFKQNEKWWRNLQRLREKKVDW